MKTNPELLSKISKLIADESAPIVFGSLTIQLRIQNAVPTLIDVTSHVSKKPEELLLSGKPAGAYNANSRS